MQELQKNASKLGIKLEQPFYIVARDENASGWVRELENELNKGGRPQMIVSFIPEKAKDRLYPVLKEFCLHRIYRSHIMQRIRNLSSEHSIQILALKEPGISGIKDSSVNEC